MNSELLISLLVDFNFSLYAFIKIVRLVDFQKWKLQNYPQTNSWLKAGYKQSLELLNEESWN